jgi:hypothetical protein
MIWEQKRELYEPQISPVTESSLERIGAGRRESHASDQRGEMRASGSCQPSLLTVRLTLSLDADGL